MCPLPPSCSDHVPRGWAGPGPTQTTCKWDANSRVQQCTRASPVPDTTALHTARVCFTNYFRYTTLTSSWRNVQEWGCCEKIVGDGNWGNFTVEKTETWPRDRISWGGAGVTQCDVWRVTCDGWRWAMWDVIRYCSLSHLMLSESRERGWRMQCSIHNPHCPSHQHQPVSSWLWQLLRCSDVVTGPPTALHITLRVLI